jgi:DNA-binding transcriptional MerR regulator
MSEQATDTSTAEDETAGQLTIDELAAASGVPSRTIRFYQSKGTLPPPRRKGRVAYYSPDHLERLKVISELQERGLRLDAIRDALAGIGREGGNLSLQAWLGVGEMQVPWSDDRPVEFTEDEMRERLSARPELLDRLIEEGQIEPRGEGHDRRYLVHSSGLFDIGTGLARAGIDPLVALEATKLMRSQLGKLADQMVGFWFDHAGQGFGGTGEPEQIVASVAALRPLGMRAVQILFAHEIERALRKIGEQEHVTELDEPAGDAEAAE